MNKNLVLRFAGEGGQGTVGGADLFASAAAQHGYHVMTFSTFPSQIKGGPAWGQARISTEPILTSGDYLDVLVAQNQYAYDHNIEELREGGIVVYNSEEFELPEGGRAFGLPSDQMARDAGNPLASTIILIGAVAQMVGIELSLLERFIEQRWSRGRPGDDAIVEGNIRALHMGAEAAADSRLNIEELDEPPEHEGERIIIQGAQAAGAGAIAAGVDSFIGYPISPATTMLVYMEQNLVGEGKFVGQASSEIESIAALIGAGYSGATAMTSTAGPGLSLMGEGLGLAWMAEIPLVVVDVQRGGPATGLPTKTEQSDLLMAMNPGHGDMSLPVIAPGSVEEAFWGTVAAVDWSERYQGPVILLSELSIAERFQDIPRPDVSSLVAKRRTVSTNETGNRYTGDSVSPFPVPGGPGAYVANGSEHDETGDTTHLPEVHVRMTHRRFAKLDLLDDGTYEAEHSDASVALLPWGGSKGPARAAYLDLIESGRDDLAWYFTMFINPLPSGLLEELRTKDLVLVPELNYLGQFANHLRSMGVKTEAITQYTGLPFKTDDLKARILARLSEPVGARS